MINSSVLQLLSATILCLNFVTVHGWTNTHRVKRVVGGERANVAEFPYQVYLRNDGIYICGGALITERHVLTAAHCIDGLIDEPRETLKIVAGTIKSDEKNPTYSYAVEEVQYPPTYRFGVEHSWKHDIAVITLATNISEINSMQAPIALPDFDTKEHQEAVVTGWGNESPHGYPSHTLRKLEVRVIDNKECQGYYKNHIEESQICTIGEGTSGACKGDSGSPLVSDGVIIGIFSWTSCETNSPNVFTRVYDFLKFINDAMKKS